ncbi:Usg-like family protein [Acetobacteraceae bacterium H6797]|nr:Usg-like family protein [Acetobacteraceae bacterium H6797]
MQLQDIERLVRIPDWRLTTAEILYRMPDHPALLQTFIWQKVDLAPRFPELHGFLAFWEKSLDGKLHSVRVASATLSHPAEFRYADGQFLLN